MDLKQFLLATYGLEGELTRLGGDLDANYLFEGSFGRRIFKLMHTNFDRPLIEMQAAALGHLQSKNLSFETPRVIPALSGAQLVDYTEGGTNRIGWMISHLSGTLMAKARPWQPALTASLGTSLAQLDNALSDFQHPSLKRDFHWDITQAHWVKDKLHLHTTAERRTLIEAVCQAYGALQSKLDACTRTVTHHDANDMNLFVANDLSANRLSGILDFGDLIYSARIGEVAVAAAYTSMDSDNPLANAAALLAAYHAEKPLSEGEIDLFFPLMLMRLAVTVTNSAERILTEPDDPYLILHSAPGWRLLERYHGINTDLVTGYFRQACGLAASTTCGAVSAWLLENSGSFAALFKNTDLNQAYKLDLSYSSPTAVNTPEAQDTLALNASINAVLQEHGAPIAIGGYGEARPIYTGAAFGRDSNKPLAPIRTHHLGVDISLPAGTRLYAPTGGAVWDVGYAADPLDYGGYIILEHTIPSGEKLYSLYGHLALDSLSHLQKGGIVSAGDLLAEVGDYTENGGWWPHLHLQLMTETPAQGGTPPGACEALLFEVARSLYPNPATLMNVVNAATNWVAPHIIGTENNALQISRVWKHFLFDTHGRTYLDASTPPDGKATPAHCGTAIAALMTKGLNALCQQHDFITAGSNTGACWSIILASDPTARHQEHQAVDYIIKRLQERQIVAAHPSHTRNELRFYLAPSFDEASVRALLLQLSLVLGEYQANPAHYCSE